MPDFMLGFLVYVYKMFSIDDRAVRDLERKAALMHFSTDQASLLTEHLPASRTSEQRSNPRVEHVKSLAKPPYCKLDGRHSQVITLLCRQIMVVVIIVIVVNGS